ncbi:MAG TPA: retropepsin-like aspartic protease [Candidatus Baltobacteraceae bacterium]|nr:retropepsin-like aspartic protease [Candidatus Baltobacteraceae bacterium]
MHSLRSFAVVAGLVLLCASSAFADDGNALKAKHVAYTGWQFGSDAVSSLDITETITRDSDAKVLRTEHWKSIGALFRQDTAEKQSAENFSTGFTGNVFWRSDASGFTVPLIGKVDKYILASDLVFTDAVTALPWIVRGSSTVDGTACTIVHVEQQNSLPIDLCVDPASGAYKRVTIGPGTDYETTFDVLAYGEVTAGRRIITRYKYEGSTATHTVTAMSANDVTTGELHPPVQTAAWDFSNPKPFPIELSPHRIVVNATVNGVQGKFMLDTGASEIFFSREFAAKAHLKSAGSFEAHGIVSALDVQTARVDSLTVGGNTLHNVMVAYGGDVLDPAVPDGQLGFSLLAGADVTLDVSNQTMQIQPPGTLDLTKIPGVRVGVDLVSGQPSVPMKLDDTIDVDATIDSGNPQEVLISPDLATKYGLKMLVDPSLAGYFSSHRGMRGIGANYEVVECGHIDEMELGPIHYTYVGACKSPSFSGRAALVSLDFLRNFDTIYFAYPRATMVLVPPKS